MTNLAPIDPEWSFATSDEYTQLIEECPCDCGTCLQLTEDGEVCQLCRVGLHDAESE